MEGCSGWLLLDSLALSLGFDLADLLGSKVCVLLCHTLSIAQEPAALLCPSTLA